MQTVWDSETLRPLAARAMSNAALKVTKARETLRAAYTEKPVMCGFLWLRRRPPTEKEVDARLKASRNFLCGEFDEAWWDIADLEADETNLRKIYSLCDLPCATIYLSDHDSQLIHTYSTERK